MASYERDGISPYRFLVKAEARRGKLRLEASTLNGGGFSNMKQRALSAAVWFEDASTVRLSLLEPSTGILAHLEGHDSAITLCRSLGLTII